MLLLICNHCYTTSERFPAWAFWLAMGVFVLWGIYFVLAMKGPDYHDTDLG